MKRLKAIGILVLLCASIQAKDIRAAFSLFIHADLSESRVTRLFRDYLETIDDLEFFAGGDPSYFVVDPETDVFVHITILEVGSSYAVVMYPSDRTLMNSFLETAYLPNHEAMLRTHFFVGRATYVINQSLETAIGRIVDIFDEYLEVNIRPYSSLY